MMATQSGTRATARCWISPVSRWWNCTARHRWSPCRWTSRRCATGATSFPRIWMRMPLFSNREDHARTMKNPTLVNHPPDVSPPPGNQPVIAPIYQSVKYEFDTVDETLRMLRGEKPGYFYMRASNPTTRQLELTLARLQGRGDCLATASGVNA